MVVGIASVILMVSAGQGAQKRILDRIRNMGTNRIVINAGQTQIIAGRQRQMTTVTTLVLEDAEAMAKECPSVALVAPFVSKKLTVRWEDQTANTIAVGISLLVGGVGILAVMLISIRERRGEIGLRRALGARCRDIRVQFLIESVLRAGTGAATGVMVGIACAYGLSTLGYWETLIPWPSTAIAFGFSAILGVFFGMYPASRAARLDPIEALRAE